MSALLVFGATFIAVFTLGLQSINVNQRQYAAAAVTSVFIGGGHMWLYEVMSHPTGWDRLAYLVGGITGITASIWFHQRVRTWWTELQARRRLRKAVRRRLDEHATQHLDTH